jgi:hypothetical protein
MKVPQMNMTRHARLRLDQRGIPAGIVNVLAEIGEATPAPGGAVKLAIPKRQKSAVISELKKLIHAIEKASESEVVLSQNGAILTAYHRR